MKILVLGCNGMAGHLISLYFKEKGHEVVGFARQQSADVYVHRSLSVKANVSVESREMLSPLVSWNDLLQIMHWKMISNQKKQKKQMERK